MFYSIDTLLFIVGIISVLLWLITTIKDFKKGTYNPFGYNHPFELILVILITIPTVLFENKIYVRVYSLLAITIITIPQIFICTKMYLSEKKLKYLLNSLFMLSVYSFFIKYVIERLV